METKVTTSKARQRVLETADRLFYKEGIRAVGVDRIIAEAGVAKMTLYAHFASKDDLILAVMKLREESFNSWLIDAIGRHEADLHDPVLALFAALREWFESQDFRGCPFINTAIETANVDHPNTRYVREQKERFSQLIREVIEKSVGPRGATNASAIALLVEGAIITAAIQGKSEPADIARDAALQLLKGTVQG